MQRKNIAQPSVAIRRPQEEATPVKIESISYLGKQDVYNMTVLGYHNYLINGGIISHNCLDGTRYLCMGFWQYIKQLLPNISDKSTEGE